MISFTQTQFWADLNNYYNGIEPKVIEGSGISCLFGIDKKNAAWISFGGPVLREDTSLVDLRNFLISLIAQAKKEKIYQINFRAFFPLRQWSAEFEEEFLKFGFKRQEWKTFMVDLRLSEDNLLKSFEHSARKGIKKAQSLDVQIRKCETFDAYFSQFLVPYFEATNRPILDREFYKGYWEQEANNFYSYWVAEDSAGEKLGFLGSYRYDGLATEITSALTPLAFARKIPVQDILHWEVMRHHKMLGDSYFDLAGFNPNPATEKEKNIKKFKEKWGGDIYDVSSYVLDDRSFIQKLILKVKQKIHA